LILGAAFERGYDRCVSVGDNNVRPGEWV
jgi:hypothetical protein